MDLELKHLGQTIAIGGFTIYAIALLLRMYSPKINLRFFDSSEDRLQLQEAAVYLALVFAVGIVLEDVSKNLSSGRDSFLGSSIDRVLDTDKERRLRDLFNVYSFSASEVRLKKSEISEEFFRLENKSSRIQPHIDKLKTLLSKEKIRKELDEKTGKENGKEFYLLTGEDVKTLLDNVNSIYYSAKNSVYRADTHFKELSEIQSRIDFTRSLKLLCIAFFLIYSIGGILSFAPPIARFFIFDRTKGYKILGISLLFLLGVWLSGKAYRSESTNYNLRVYGYYVSQQLEPK